MNVEARQIRLLVGFVAAAPLVFAILFGLTRLARGDVRSAAASPLAGSLDPAFGSGGVVTHTLGSNTDPGIGGVAVQPDGKIVVVTSGSAVAGFGSVVRYLPNGSLDSSFGEGGYVATGFDAYAVALQPDGKIVVAGSSVIGSEFVVVRYNPDGSPDASFGTDGITTTTIPESPCGGGSSGAYANALAILPGGDILAAGSAWWDDCDTAGASGWALARYRPDGSLDPTFGDAGVVQTSFFVQGGINGIAVQPDGKIVATGGAGESGHGGIDIATMALARYEPDGLLDPSFGTGGKVTTNPQLFYGGGPPELQHGKILVAGSTSKNGNTKPWFPVLARYEASGRLDSTFGQHGFAEIRSVQGGPTAMLAQKDGKILIAENSDRQFKLVRLLPNGRLDRSFGRGGIASLPGAITTTATLALQGEQKILVGGGSSIAWTLARLIGGNNCVVPGLRGRTVSKASASLKTSYCRRGRISRRFSSNVTRGRVISTEPRRDARRPGRTKVDLVVSKGKRP